MIITADLGLRLSMTAVCLHLVLYINTVFDAY